MTTIKNASEFNYNGEFKRYIQNVKKQFLRGGPYLFLADDDSLGFKRTGIRFVMGITAQMPEKRSPSSMIVTYKNGFRYAEWAGSSKIYIEDVGSIEMVGGEINERIKR